jgi:hypothetical protein
MQIQPAAKADFLRMAGFDAPQVSVRLLVHAAHAALHCGIFLADGKYTTEFTTKSVVRP